MTDETPRELENDRTAMMLGLVPDKRSPEQRLLDAVLTNGESVNYRHGVSAVPHAEEDRLSRSVIEYQAVSDVVDRTGVARDGISAAGVPIELVDEFVELTGEIVQCESGWQPNAVAVDFDHYPLGAAADGADYAAPRGLTGMQPRLFQQYRAAGTSTNIYDPVASIAALWRFVAAHFGVDLATGDGLPEFRRFWRAHRRSWWNVPWPPLILPTQVADDFDPGDASAASARPAWRQPGSGAGPGAP